tara:strand:- start:86 stop:217 length:132 start_codon:yes stop_codon:yes gene_type:complete
LVLAALEVPTLLTGVFHEGGMAKIQFLQVSHQQAAVAAARVRV